MYNSSAGHGAQRTVSAVARSLPGHRPVDVLLEEEKMIKTLLFAGFASALAMGAASAADLCNDDHMKQMDQMIADMTDEAKQKEAMAALDQSKAAMKDGDTDECMKYMGEAHAAMGL
ncbi:hypothetical protein AUC71_00275 [Methyloceanibacter marginalis]|uniref:Uncharacterized protein n=2 Tax=Methyloceanibacter marginalis TaxID=1774971 RepID=A0A1E3W6R6_9HYPH|nr:hypothetical protein AUC71_00275 [Methyloceanibacter marginalis]